MTFKNGAWEETTERDEYILLSVMTMMELNNIPLEDVRVLASYSVIRNAMEHLTEKERAELRHLAEFARRGHAKADAIKTAVENGTPPEVAIREVLRNEDTEAEAAAAARAFDFLRGYA